MSTTSRVGTALAAGYLLGRFKKLRLALVVGSALASDDVRSTTARLITKGPGGLAAPAAQKVGQQISSQLLDAGKAAAVGAASSRLDSMSDRLNKRTASLQGRGGKASEDTEYDEEEPYEEDAYEDEGYDEAADEEPAEDEYEGDEEEAEDFEEEPSDEEPGEEPGEESEDLGEEEPEEEPEEEEPPARKRSPRRRRSATPAGR